MKTGYKTTEFWIVVAVIVYALALAVGIIKPSSISQAAQNIKSGTEAMPDLVGALKNLLDKYSELAVMAGLAWAYLKRRGTEKTEVAKQGTSIQEIISSPPPEELASIVKGALKEVIFAAKKTNPPA